MTLPTSGAISLGQVQTEFGGSNPISITEYYSGGAYVPSGTKNGAGNVIPTNGQVSMDTFYAAKNWQKTYATMGDGDGYGNGSGLVYGAHTTRGGNAGMPGLSWVQNWDTGANLFQVNVANSEWFPLIITLNNNYRLGSSDMGYTYDNVPIFMWRNQYSNWTDAMITNELGMNSAQIARSKRASQVWWEASYAGMDNAVFWGLAVLNSYYYNASSPGNAWRNAQIIPYWYAYDFGDEWQGHGFITTPSLSNYVATVPQTFARTGATNRDGGGYASSQSNYAITIPDNGLVIPVLASDNGFSGGAYNGARNPLTARFGYIGVY